MRRTVLVLVAVAACSGSSPGRPDAGVGGGGDGAAGAVGGGGASGGAGTSDGAGASAVQGQAGAAAGVGAAGTGAAGVAGTGAAGAAGTGAAGSGVAGTGAAGTTGAADACSAGPATGTAGAALPTACSTSVDCVATCAGTQLIPAGICNQNVCSYTTPEACRGDFVCGGGACKTSCASDCDCVATSFCGESGCHIDAVALATGEYHSCVVVADGSVACWGDGFGSAGQTFPIKDHPPTLVPGLTNATAVTVGQVFACALRNDGSVWCWGGNYLAQLGDGTLIDDLIARPVMKLAKATAIASGTAHTCAVVEGGRVACWGWDKGGQLGDGAPIGSPESSPVPLIVPGVTDAIGVSASNTHSCALRAGGSVVCWGMDYSGQLGDGATTVSFEPSRGIVTVKDLSGVKRIVSSENGEFTCALLADDTMRCWGQGNGGRVGTGDEGNAWVPVAPKGFANQRITAMAAGSSHTCVVRAGGGVSCWGYGPAFGRPATDGPVYEPVDVPALAGVIALAGGAATTCGLLPDGAVICMGAGKEDELGNGVLKDSPVPVRVLGW